jgi:hypothetical protein
VTSRWGYVAALPLHDKPSDALTTGFLFKDVALLGVSVWTLTDALRATRSSLAGSSQLHAT